MRIKSIIVLLLTVLCILLTSGCGTKEEKEENPVSRGEADNMVKREYEQKEKNLPLIELSSEDVVYMYAKLTGAVVEATYMEQIDDVTVEAEDGTEEKVNVSFHRYLFTLNDIIRTNGDESVEREFILLVNTMYDDVFPDLEEGDRVIIGVRENEQNIQQEVCYIWNDVSLFYIKSDGTVFSAYMEDNQYDGWKSEDFKKQIAEYQAQAED